MPEFREIIKDISNRKFAPVYILMGEETYYLDKITEALEAKVVEEADKEFDESILYGADTNPSMVIEAASQFPFVSEYRFVALKEAQAMVQAKIQLEKLASYMSNPNPNTVLAIVFKGGNIGARSELIKGAKKIKEAVIFESPLIREYKVGGVVKDYCAAEKISIEDRALELLIANVGSSLSKLFSEIEKLKVAFKEGEKRITADMIHEHIGVSKEFNNFELVNALSRRDYYQAINIVKHFEENPKGNPTIVTASTIFNHFQKLTLAAFSQDKSDRSLMETLQLKTPYALKEIRMGLANYNATQLVAGIHAIREFDRKSKGVESFQKEFPLLLELVCRLVTL